MRAKNKRVSNLGNINWSLRDHPKTDGYINYDSKLEEKFKNMETNLRSKLQETRKERKQFSMGTIPSASHQFSNTDSDSNQPDNVELDSNHPKNVEFELNRPNNVEFDLNKSIDSGFEFFGYDFWLFTNLKRHCNFSVFRLGRLHYSNNEQRQCWKFLQQP